MHKKSFLPGILILILIVFIGNWVLGKMIARNVETHIVKVLKAVNPDINIRIDDIGVNPICSKVELYGLVLTAINDREIATCTQVEIDMPITESFRLLKSKGFDEFKDFTWNMNDLMFHVQEANQVHIDELVLDFEGHLSRESLKVINKTFPSEKQYFNLDAKNIYMSNAPWVGALGLTDDQEEQFSQLDHLMIDVAFNPQNKEFIWKDLQCDSPLLSAESQGSLTYKSDGLKGMAPLLSTSTVDVKLNEDGVKWGNSETTGRISLDNLEMQVKSSVSYEDSVPLIKSHSSQVLLENLTLEYTGQKKAMMEAKTALLGLKMDQLNVSLLKLQSTIKDNKMVVENSMFKSSLFNAEINALIHLNPLKYRESNIVESQLVVSNLIASIQNGLSTFEFMTGQALPRKGNDIVLELNGSLSKPKIKGLMY